MRLNHLLLWLSAKRQGSWSQFRGAVDELCEDQGNGAVDADDEGTRPGKTSSDLPVYQQARFALQRLGHVEFFSSEIARDWGIVPPTLALRSSHPSEALLCGARSPEFLDRLDHTDGLEVVKTPALGMPDRIVVRASSETLALSAAQLGLMVQHDASMAILSAVPRVRDPAIRCRTEIPENPGWTVHRFSSSRQVWSDSTGMDARNARTGFFRFVMGYQRLYFLRWRSRSYRVTVQVGKYVVMRRTRGLLAYDRTSQTLSVPAMCRPPLLIERALVLCSGLLPSFDPPTARLEYADVPREEVRLAAQLLGQELER